MFYCALLLTTFCFGQDFSISGFVDDEQGQPVKYSTVLAMKAQDSTVVNGVSSNDEGFFLVKQLAPDHYIIKISFLGYKDVYQTITLDKSIDLGTIVLEENAETLNEINIIAKRPTLKKEADRLIFNIENTALVEGNMFQVLKSTPGILVLDNQISVKNINPTVYINDKKVHLSNNELIQLLESSSANTIKSVEVITNPSAKYDASSGAVINIVMSKNLISGYRGNVFTNYAQGVFPRYQVGTSHFFKSQKVDFFANYTYSDDKINQEEENIVNYLDANSSIDQIFKSNIRRNTWSKTHNFNFNFDYSLNDSNTLSLSSNILALPSFEYLIDNDTDVFDSTQNLDYYIHTKNASDDEKYNLGFDLDFVHNFKKTGEKLSVNAHFTSYDYNRNQSVLNNYFESDNTFLQNTEFRTDNKQDTKIYTAQADYLLPINESSTLEVGMKSSNIQNNSSIARFNIANGSETIDPNNTNAFNYDEMIFAGYMNYSKDWEKFSVIAGLRAEQTNTKGISVFDDQINKQDYFEIFPTISLNYKLSDNLSLYTNYKRSISRPDYQKLNPFQFYLNDFTIVAGNPALKPVISDHAVIGTSFFKIFTFEAYYLVSNKNIYELPRQNNENNTITYTALNLDKTIDYGFDFSTYFDVVNNWSVYFLTSFFNINDKGEFNDIKVSSNQWSNYSMLSNDFTFLKDRSLNTNFTLTYVSKNQVGLQEISSRLVSNLSISKSVFKKQGVISLSATDLFNTQDFSTTTNYLRQSNYTFFDRDDRYIKLEFRYKFGNTNLQTNQRTKEQQETERLDGN